MTSGSWARLRDSLNDSLDRERAKVARTSKWSENELAGVAMSRTSVAGQSLAPKSNE